MMQRVSEMNKVAYNKQQINILRTIKTSRDCFSGTVCLNSVFSYSNLDSWIVVKWIFAFYFLYFCIFLIKRIVCIFG